LAKKILLINKSLCFGGIETVMQTQYFSFSKEHDVDILLFKRENISDINDNNIDYFDQYKSLKKFMNNKEKDRKYDLIICHAQSERICKQVKSLKRNNVLYVIHGMQSKKLLNGNFFARYLRKKRKQALYKNENLVTVSNAVKKDIEAMNIKPKKLETIYNPFNVDKIMNLSRQSVEKYLPEKYIVWVGRISEVKNLPLLFEIYKYISSQYELVIVGDGNDKLLNELKRKAKSMNIEDRVHFIGSRKNPYPYINNADALILTSKEEGLPTVIIEALILHTPVFGVDIPAVNELLSKYYRQGLLQETPKKMSVIIEKNIFSEFDSKKVQKDFSSSVLSIKYINYL